MKKYRMVWFVLLAGMIVVGIPAMAQETGTATAEQIKAAAPAATPAAAPAATPAAAPAATPAATPADTAAADAAKAPEVRPAAVSALELRKTGTISVIKDAAGKVTALRLIVNMYEIPMDEGSKPLESMDGQRVRVLGTFSQEGGRRLFSVKSVEPVTAEGAGGVTPAP